MCVSYKVLLLVTLLMAATGSIPIGPKGDLPDMQGFYSPGELPVNHTSFYNALSLFLDTNLEVYAPNAPGNFPVVYFLTGVTDVVPATSYSNFLTHIASHGFVAVGIWKLDSPLNSFNASWMEATINFVERRLENELHKEGYDSELNVDYLNSLFASHSSGSHIALAQLETECLNFRGLVLLSPVDGGDPYGELPYFVITPGQKVNFSIPTMQLVAGLDHLVSPVTGVACAPDFLSGRRFFDAMSGPAWYINATDYGHADFMDSGAQKLVEENDFCGNNPKTPKKEYNQFVGGQVVSFLKAVLDPVDNCYLFENLERSGTLGIETVNDYADNGWARCTALRCQRVPA